MFGRLQPAKGRRAKDHGGEAADQYPPIPTNGRDPWRHPAQTSSPIPTNDPIPIPAFSSHRYPTPVIRPSPESKTAPHLPYPLPPSFQWPPNDRTKRPNLGYQSPSAHSPDRTAISGGSAFGQISLLADVATREAEGEILRGRDTMRMGAHPRPRKSTSSPASSDWPQLGRWYPPSYRGSIRRSINHAAQAYSQPSQSAYPTQPEFTSSPLPPSRADQKNNHKSPVETSQHPLSGLTLDRYAPYVPGEFARDVRKVLATPTLAHSDRLPAKEGGMDSAQSSSLPQWPPNQSQVYGRAELGNGRAWTFSLEAPHGTRSASHGHISPNTRWDTVSLPPMQRRLSSPVPRSREPSKRPRTQDVNNPSETPGQTPAPSRARTPSGDTDRMETDKMGPIRDCAVAGREPPFDTAEKLPVGEYNFSWLDVSPPAQDTLFKSAVILPPSPTVNTRAHSLSLSSSASAPTSNTEEADSSSPYHPQACRRATSEPNKTESPPKRKSARRGGPRRKMQNAEAAKKHWNKKKLLNEQKESELARYRSELDRKARELEQLREERDRYKRVAEEMAQA